MKPLCLALSQQSTIQWPGVGAVLPRGINDGLSEVGLAGQDRILETRAI